MGLPGFLKFGIMVDFKINQDFIAKVLCVNKEKPELQCNGKCHLAKELKKLDNPTERNAPAQKIEELKLEYFATNFSIQLKKDNKKQFISKKFYFKKNSYQSIYLNKIFHPPKSSFHFTV